MKRIVMAFTLFIFFLASSAAIAEENIPQPATPAAKAFIHGKVMVLGSSEPLEGAMVDQVENTLNAAGPTPAGGAYSISADAPGELHLRFSAYGFETKVKTLVTKPGEEIKTDVYLDKVDFISDAVVVRAKKDKNEVVKTTIQARDIKKVPGTAGDTMRAVQSLPGIAVSSDFSSGLAVQGGGAGDNLYLLDGVPWPFPFHFGGLMSTVYSGLLTSVDLNTAGFSAQWGNVMGAVLDAKTRPGSKEGFHLSADISMITSQAMLECPLGLGDASMTIYGRRSYIDLLLGKMVQSLGFTAFPYFWDLGGTLDFSLGKDNRFRGLALANDDILKMEIDSTLTSNADYTGEFMIDNGAFTGGLSWTNTSAPGLVSKLTAYYYNLYEKEKLGSIIDLDIGQYEYGVKGELEWGAGEFLWLKHNLGLGLEITRVHDAATVSLAANIFGGVSEAASTEVNGWHVMRGGYLQDRVELLPGLEFTAGVRYDKNDMVGHDITLPRFCLSWQSDELTLWKAAWGGYSQFPTDVQLNEDFGNPFLEPNLAQHTAVSVERKLTREIMLRFDVYYKYYTGLVTSVDTAEIYNNSGSGTAKGADAYLDARFGEKFFGWISYALSKSERISPNSGGWGLYQYDQTNIATMVAGYNFSPAWSVGAKLHYNTGPLVKKLLGRYQDAGGTWHGVFSDNYARRLDDYMRLDLRTDYAFRFEGWKLNLYIELINALGRPNPAELMYSDDYSSSQAIKNLPFMPYFGLEAEF